MDASELAERIRKARKRLEEEMDRLLDRQKALFRRVVERIDREKQEDVRKKLSL